MQLEYIREMARLQPVDVAELQFEFLRRQLARVVGPGSEWYREAWKGAGFRPQRFESVADLARLPLTTPDAVAPEGPVQGPGNPFVVGGAAGRAGGVGRLVGALGRLFGGKGGQAEEESHPCTVSLEEVGGRTLALYATRHDVLEAFGPAAGHALAVAAGEASPAGLRVLDVTTRVHSPEALHAAWAATAAGCLVFRAPLGGEGPGLLPALAFLQPRLVLARAEQVEPLLAALSGATIPGSPTLALVVGPGEAPALEDVTGRWRSLCGAQALVTTLLRLPGARMLLPACDAAANTFVTYPHLHLLEVLAAEGDQRAPEGQPGRVCLTHVGGRGTALVRFVSGARSTALPAATCPRCHLPFAHFTA
jgi:hypothetical protein